jgi:hypothetical protein
MLTDYALAVAAMVFAVRLFQLSLRQKHRAIGLWAIAFGLVAIAAGLGGTCHGFTHYLSNTMLHRLWYAMLCALSGASFFMLTATLSSSLPRRWQRWLWLAIATKTLLYLTGVTVHHNFAYAIADYLSAMFIMLIVETRSLYQGNQVESARWIVAGILVSVVAVGVQGLGVTIAGLNHNDWYHLVQLVGLYLLYRGASCQSPQYSYNESKTW